MELKLITVFIVVFACICQCTAFFSWTPRRQLQLKAKTVTCNVQELDRQTAEMSFRPRLACDNNALDTVAVGAKCTFVYSCPLDAPGTQKRSAMVCGKNGEWSGAMPDCSADQRLAQSIIDIFEGGVLTGQQQQEQEKGKETNEERERKEPEEEEEVNDAEQPTNSVQQTTPKKRGRNPAARRTYKDMCSELNVCQIVHSLRDCQTFVVRKSMSRKQKRQRVGLCYYCYVKFCPKAVTLL